MNIIDLSRNYLHRLLLSHFLEELGLLNSLGLPITMKKKHLKLLSQLGKGLKTQNKTHGPLVQLRTAHSRI